MTGLLKIATLALTEPEQETIASGVAIATQGVLQLTSESSTSDDLDTLTFSGNLDDYLPFVILLAAAGHTIAVKHNTGNIHINAASDFSLTDAKALLLWFDGTDWHNLS